MKIEMAIRDESYESVVCHILLLVFVDLFFLNMWKIGYLLCYKYILLILS